MQRNINNTNLKKKQKEKVQGKYGLMLGISVIEIKRRTGFVTDILLLAFIIIICIRLLTSPLATANIVASELWLDTCGFS